MVTVNEYFTKMFDLFDQTYLLWFPTLFLKVFEFMFCLSLRCIYCDKEFKDFVMLKEHMRKKNHKRIDPKDQSYDKYYMINYLVWILIDVW